MQICEVKSNYRSRTSLLPEGQYDLKKGENVEVLTFPSVGSIYVKKKDGTKVYVSKEHNFILKPLNENNV